MRTTLWLLVCLLAATSVAGQPEKIQSGPVQAPALVAAVARSRELIGKWQREHHIPGLSAAVSVDGRVVWSEGFGWADLEQRVPATPRTRFRIGSVSKMFAAVALVKLAEQGRIDLDAPIQQYVPGFPVKAWPITARQLSGHLAGIRHYRDKDFAADAPVGRNEHFLTDRDALAIFADDPLEFEPGTQSRYSSYGYTLLAAVIAGAAGAPYQQVVHDLVTTPLGLDGVGADHPYHLVPDRARFYVHRPDIGATLNAGFTDNSYKWAGGGFLSTAEDLVRFASALTEPGLLAAASLELMFTPQTMSGGKPAISGGAPIGIGWRVDRDGRGRRRFHHGGSLTGGGAILLALRDDKVSVAIVTNQLPRPTEDMTADIAGWFAATR